MANTSIGGLISGLDTASIISQLMQLEAQPQTRLKTKVTVEQSAVTALQALNAKLSSLATKTADLAKAAGWGLSAATSSSANVTAAADSGATPASLTFKVTQTATRSQAIFADDFTRSAQATTATTLDLKLADGTLLNISTGDGSLEDIAAAVNAATLPDTTTDAGLSAVLVRADTSGAEPTYRLMVTSDKTGKAAAFTVEDTTFLGELAGHGRPERGPRRGRDAVRVLDQHLRGPDAGRRRDADGCLER